MSETTIIALLQWELGWEAERAQEAYNIMAEAPGFEADMSKEEILAWALAADNIRAKLEAL